MRFKPLLFIAFVCGLLHTHDARAQSVAVSKDLCPPSGPCVIQSQGSVSSVPPYTPVTYPLTLVNNGAPVSVDLVENFPAGFHLTGMTCGQSSPTMTTSGTVTIFSGIALATGSTICTISGWFEFLSGSANSASNTVGVFASTDTTHTNPLGTSTVNANVSGSAPLPTDVAVNKAASIVSTDPNTGAITVHYTVTVTNNGPTDVYGFLLQDRLSVPPTGVPLIATFNGGTCAISPGQGGGTGTSVCVNPVPSISNSPLTVLAGNPMDFLEWRFPAGSSGLLKAGDTMVIEFDVVVSKIPTLACVRDPQGNFLRNDVHVSFNLPGSSTTITDANPANNTASQNVQIIIDAPVNATCGSALLAVQKTQDTPNGSGLSWGSTVNYTITVTNTSTTETLSNIQLVDPNGVLGDIVTAGIGTPVFTAELMSWLCQPTNLCSGTQPSVGTSQMLTGYGDNKWMFGTTIPSLPPNQSVTIQIGLKYSNPGCDSYSSLVLKPIHNFLRATYEDASFGVMHVQTPAVTAQMLAPAVCNFTVAKTLSNATAIEFNTPVTYMVTFGNPNPNTSTLGTLIDALRIVEPGYATQLPASYSYTCAPSSPGMVTGYPASGSGQATIVHTSLPQQGVRIIQNTTPVVFQAQSSLICTVTVTVSRPAAGDPNCSRTGTLENAAIMDTSAFYNPNLPWPSGSDPGYAAKVATPLPQCLNLVVNKSVNPIWTTQNGGPLSYSLTITNQGDAIVPADGVLLGDAFAPVPASLAATTWSTVCVPVTSNCTPAWSPAPNVNPSSLSINALGTGQAVVTNFTVNGPFTAPPSQLCNTALASVSGLSSGGWYAKNPDTWSTTRCVPIFDVRPVQVSKSINVVAPAVTPPATPTHQFNVNLMCSYIQNGVQYGPNASLIFSYPPVPQAQSVQNIPVGSNCSVIELQPMPPPVPMASCASGLAGWGPVSYPAQSLTVSATQSNKLEVLNTFACLPPVVLNVAKTFDASSPASQFPATSVFPVQVACSGMPTTTVNLVAPTFQQTVANITPGALCTVTELAPYGTDVQATCSWEVTYPSGQSAQANAGVINLEVHNKLKCTATLHVYKEFEPASLASQMPAGAAFPVQISCGNAYNNTVMLSSANQFNFATPALPTGAVCSILELTPVGISPPSNCQWATDYPKGQSVTLPNGSASLIARNRFTCAEPPPIDLAITKSGPTPYGMGGSMQAFTLTVTNLGAGFSGANVITISDVATGLVGMIGGVIPSNSDWTCGAPGGNAVNCTYIGTGPTGPNQVLGTFTVVFVRWTAASFLNCSTVGVTSTAGIQESTLANNVACVGVGVDPQKGALTIGKITTNLSPIAMPNPPFPVTVDCQTGGPNVTLQLAAGGMSQAVWNIPPGSTCSITETVPPITPPTPEFCQWVTSLVWDGVSYPNGSQITNIQPRTPTPLHVDVRNDFICTPPPPAGKLVIRKHVSDQAGASPNGATFAVTVNCSNAFSATVGVSPGNAQTINNIPVGVSCVVDEPVATMPALSGGKCTAPAVPVWAQPTYAPGQTIAIASANGSYVVDIRNRTDCVVFSSLTVTKSFAPTSLVSQLPPGASFPVQVDCTPPPGTGATGANPTTTIVTLTAANQFQSQIPGIVSGSTCSLTELPPQGTSIAPNCHWEAFYPGGKVPVVNGATSAGLTNSLVCVNPAATLNLFKTASNLSPIAMPNGPFPVTVNCQSMSQTVGLMSGGATHSVSNIPIGANCTINETYPPLPSGYPLACHWETTLYWDGLPHPNGSQILNVQNLSPPKVIEVHNDFICLPPTPRSLIVTKSVTNLTGGIAPAGPFTINVACTSGGPNVNFTIAAGASHTVANIPAGATCAVNETQTPPPYVAPPGTGCPALIGWTLPASYSPMQSVIIQGAGPPQEVIVNNTFSCNPTMNGTLLVKKSILYDTVNVTGQQQGNFDVTVACTNPVSTQTVTLTHANNYQVSIPNLTINAQCTVTEQLPQNPSTLPAGEQWIVTYPAGQQVTIAGGTQTFMVNNERVLNTTPVGQSDLRIDKLFTRQGYPVNIGPLTFQVDVACVGPNGSPLPGSPFPVSLTVAPGQPGSNSASTHLNVPTGSTCTANEPTLPSLPNNVCTWNTPAYEYRAYGMSGNQSGPTVTLSVTQQTYVLRVKNRVSCPPPVPPPPPPFVNVSSPDPCPAGTILRGASCVKPPLTCVAPLVPNAAGTACIRVAQACKPGEILRNGECTKPVTCRKPLVPTAAGSCECPAGTTRRGEQCVKPVVCRAPMTLNAAGTACIRPPVVCKAPQVPNAARTACVNPVVACPAGTIRRGAQCIERERPACQAPARLNRRGVCECPAGFAMRGNACIPPRERERPLVTPGDIIRVLPGLIPGGGRSDGIGPGRRIDR